MPCPKIVKIWPPTSSELNHHTHHCKRSQSGKTTADTTSEERTTQNIPCVHIKALLGSYIFKQRTGDPGKKEQHPIRQKRRQDDKTETIRR
eukprot:6428027-Amphidinium_carterae.3